MTAAALDSSASRGTVTRRHGGLRRHTAAVALVTVLFAAWSAPAWAAAYTFVDTITGAPRTTGISVVAASHLHPVGRPFVARVDGTITTLRAFAQAVSGSGNNGVLELRADNAGEPGTVLASGGFVAPYAAPSTPVEVTFDGVAVTAGTRYWVVMTGESGVNWRYQSDADSTYYVYSNGSWTSETAKTLSLQVTGADAGGVPVDTTAPVVTVPTRVTIEASGPAGAVVTFTASAHDDFDGPVSVSCTKASGTTFPLGSTSVTCSATDEAGNRGSASFDVIVVDTTGPALTIPAPITVDATTPRGATVTWSATATDTVSGTVSVACTPESGSVFAVGETTVSCAASDAEGNETTGSFSVTVRGVDEQLDSLRDLADEVTADRRAGAGVRLNVTLAAASDAIAKGETRAACNVLRAFVHQVRTSGLDGDDADLLILGAGRIRTALDC